jgi:hypothetical protein
MVADAEGSYTESGERFGLTELVKALEEGGCKVTKAHRWNNGMPHTAGADLKGFKFASPAFMPDDYDQIWLMGFASSNPKGPYKDPNFALSDTEVEVIAKFMNDGGGVFATGDHDDLGADLCGKVPRVRSMRRWETDYEWLKYTNSPADLDTFIPNLQKSPPPVGRYRLDTLVTGDNNHYEFQDQSDDVPQQIDPVMRVLRSNVSNTAGGRIGFTESIPHPILCGSKGPITVLPDHMHEGRCFVPDDLTKTVSINNQIFDEYPKLTNGTRISPEVVAWATITARSKDPSFDDPTEDLRDSNTNVSADYFPVIVAYNGHRVNIGRVVVDSTFHHFVNINVTGVKKEFSDEPDPVNVVKSQGFLASPQGQAHYENIKAYWRNIAKWLCRRQTIVGIAWKSLRDAAFDPRLKQTIPFGNAEKASISYLRRYGASAWSLLTEQSSPCSVISWIFDIAIPDPLSILLSPEVYIDLTLPDPPPDAVIRKSLEIDKLELLHYSLGAAVLELRQPHNQELILNRKIDEGRGMKIIRQAALVGLQRGMTEQATRLSLTLEALNKVIDLSR